MNSQRVLEIFREITRIPRESGHEEPMTAWLMDWAKAHSLEARKDATGNVCIFKPASAGKENVPVLALQAHQDMVCEKNAGIEHNFLTDPIKYEIEDGWLIAKDTTLGADDGIGIAACLAVLEDRNLKTGPIECVFTISEETSMVGAENMAPDFFKAKTVINLDSEDEGQMFIGCSGGIHTDAWFSYETEPVKEGLTRVKLTLTGGLGGHSGDDINKERVNAVQQMARFVYPELADAQLVKIEGGGKSNAIARECVAVLASAAPDALEARFKAFAEVLADEYHKSDSGMTAVCERPDCKCCRPALKAADAERIVGALLSAPHGVFAMSQDIPGMVETSTNLAAIKFDKDAAKAHVVTSQRSSIPTELEMIRSKVSACFKLAGAEVESSGKYPGWKPNANSKILAQCVESYKRVFGEEPLVLTIHAGLECGLFFEKDPSLDLISFGPTLRGVHAPGEKLELASLDKFTAHLEDVVTNFR